jgi:Putative phage tail protein
MPETVGLLIFAGIEAGGIEGAAAFGGTVLFGGVTVAGAVGSAALLGASIGLAYATRPDVPKPNSDGTQTLKQPIPPRPRGYGRARLAGAYVLYEAPSSLISQDVIAMHQGRIGGYVLFYLNNDIVLFSNGGLGGGPIGIPTGADGRYSNTGYDGGIGITWLEVRLGLATETAYSNVVSEVGSLWTNAHRGDGIASIHLRCSSTSDPVSNWLHLFPRGLPRVSAVADLSPIWDPRDGAQSRTDPTTWTVSANPVLQLIDYLTSGAGYGEAAGPDLDYDTLIAPVLSAWTAQANICDEAVTKADGNTEPRYASNGWAYLSTDPADVIAALLQTCDGWLSEAGDGTLTLQVGKYSAPTVALTDDHLMGFSIDHGVPDQDVVNELKFSYVAVANDYREAPGIPWQDAASIATLGKIRSQNLSLTWVQSHSQCRRLAKRAMARHQATLRGTITTSLYGLQALGQRWLAVQSNAVADLANAVIEVSNARIDIANARVVFDWTLVNPNSIEAWDPATEEGLQPNYYAVPGTGGASPSFAVTDAGSHKIQIQFSDPSLPQVDYVTEYRIGSSGPWTRLISGVTAGYTGVVGGGFVTLTTPAVTPGTYNVRVAVRGPQGIAGLGNWTSLAGTSVTIA